MTTSKGLRRHIGYELRQAVEQLAAEAGATVTYETSGGNHIIITLWRNGASRYVTTSGTTVSRHWHEHVLKHVRHELAKLGWVKPKAAPTERRKRPWRVQPTERRERLDQRQRQRRTPDPDIYLNAMGATLALLRGKRRPTMTTPGKPKEAA